MFECCCLGAVGGVGLVAGRKTELAIHPAQLVPFVTDLAPDDIGTGPVVADGAAVKLLEAAAIGVCVLVARRKTELAIHPAQCVPFVTDLAQDDIGISAVNADSAAVKLLIAAVGVFVLVPRRCPQCFPFGGVKGQVLGETGPSTVYCVPLAPAICVELGAVADGLIAIAEVVGELEVWPALSLVAWLHPAPVSAVTAIAAENATVRFVNARISFLSN